jgi:PST family polysaccharide transporter
MATSPTPLDGTEARDNHASQLTTSHLQTNFAGRLLSGGLARVAGQVCQFVILLTSNVVLARLLNPRDFGLVVMVTSVSGVLYVFREAGLSSATIQREDITHAQVSNLFWTNAAIGIVVCLGLSAVSPVIAAFFREPPLVGIAIGISLSFLLDGLAVQHIAILNRQMRFGATSLLEVVAMVGGAVVGITMAVRGWGYWSLVGVTVSTSVIRVATAWLLCPWRPQGPTRNSGTRSLIAFGRNLTLVGVINVIARSFDSVLIGRFLGSEAVGLYSRAGALFARPFDQLLAPIHTLVVPALSRLQDQPERYRRMFLHVCDGLVISGFVFAGLFFPLARPLVIVVLGPQWEAAAPIFAALALAALYIPLSNAMSWLYTSQGRGTAFLKTASISACVTMTLFTLALPLGATGLAATYSASGLLVGLPISTYIGGKNGPVRSRDVWTVFAAHFPVFLAVLSATWAARQWLPQSSDVMQLVVCAPIGLLTGLAVFMLLPRSRRSAIQISSALRELRARNQAAGATT